jgi:hypothetical protein
MNRISDNDPDRAKGATEGEARDHDANAGLAGQLGHRDQDPLIKGADTDYPEPGNSPEYSGEGTQSKKVVKKAKRK